jgi:hypothetical protein
MLTIRSEQLQVFERLLREPFEAQVAEHLREHFPNKCAALKPGGLERFVAYAFDRAIAHGMKTLQEVSKYADLAMKFGKDFDQDPDLPWVREILEDPDFSDSDVRINFLCREALRRLAPEED